MSGTNVTNVRRGPAVAAALLLAVTACTGEEEPTAGPSPTPQTQTSSAPPSPTAEATPSESPTASPTETEASATAEPTEPAEPSSTVATTEDAPSAAPVQPPPPGAGPRDMLLGKNELPGLNERQQWRPVGTANAERRRPVWACQVTDLSSIGATDVWVRRFVDQPGGRDVAYARSAVATFADAASARRAYAVLQAWHDRCEEELRRDHRRVRVDAAPTAVEVSGPGTAEWRLAIYGPVPGDPDAGYFDATGYVREGARIGLTTMVSVGQDYNYPPGEEPIVGAVRNSAIKLRG
jgi:hypothetical protein